MLSQWRVLRAPIANHLRASRARQALRPPGTRGIAGSTEALLERARRWSEELGYDPLEVYEPYMVTDVCQQALVNLSLGFGDTAVAVVAFALSFRAMTMIWNIRAVHKQLDRTALAPVHIALSRAIQDAQKRQGGRDGSGARGAEQAEADLVILTAKLKNFMTTTSFSPLQGFGHQFLCLAPAWILTFTALRGMGTHPDAFRSFVVEPTLWLDTLVLPDPLGALPVLTASAMLANAAVNMTQPADAETALYTKFVLRGAMLTFVPLTAALPAGVLVFMFTNTAYTTALMWGYRRYCWTPPRIDKFWSP